MDSGVHRRGPLFGRAAELATLATCFEEGARLVTLVGPGGIGKTTLASAYAEARVRSAERSRAVVVDLHGASSLGELRDRLAAKCGVSFEDPIAALDALGDALVVLDDFDALVPLALATVGTWLDRCAEIELLVTSRVRLGLAAESVFEVGPLRTDGVALLVARARQAFIGFTPRREDAPALGEIASMLEGVPLALELAAARLPLVGVSALLSEVTAGARLERRTEGGLARHMSMDAVVRGSWDALSPHEREALAQLTVFRGGFTPAAVGHVVEVPGADAVELVDALRARSLVRSIEASSVRLDLYAQVRAFVVEASPRSIAAAAARHAAWFVAEAERAALHAHVAPEARAWILDERENLMEIVRRVLGRGAGVGAAAPTPARAELALRAVVAGAEVLFAGGLAAELAELVSPIVERTRDSGADVRLSARVMILRGVLRREHGDVRASLKDLLAAETVARAVGDAILCAESALELGRTVRRAGELDAARQNFERAARLFADAGARVREAEATALLGATAGERGDLEGARELCERAVAMAGADRLLGARLHLLLARAHAERGDHASARRAAEEAARRAEANGDPTTAGAALVLLGLVLHAEGDIPSATEVLGRARDALGRCGLEADAAIARGHLGVLARERGGSRTAEAYASLADAHDVCRRAGRAAHAAYFGAHLAGIEARLGRAAAAAHRLDQSCVADREADAWWPFSAAAVVAAQRAGAAPSPGDVLTRIFARTLGGRAEIAPVPSEDALVVGSGGAWFRPPGAARVGLERRRSLALVLDHLATAHAEDPGVAVGAHALFAQAWPGEKAIASAAAHRVRVAVATLRKMGLREALVTTPDGYQLAPETVLFRA